MARWFAAILIVIVLGMTCAVGSVVVFWGGLFWEASNNRVYFKTLETEQPNVKVVADFVRLFPDSHVKYSFFDGKGYPGYVAEAVLHGRYRLAMELPVTFNYGGDRIVRFGEPKFYLFEASRVQDRGISYDERGQLTYGPAEWEKIVANDGDFEAIGYSMKKDQPVAGLHELLMENK